MKSTLRELRPLRRHYSGVLWQHPAVKLVLPAVDLADRLVRTRRGLAALPPYSVRIRSASMVGEFGGVRWTNNADQLKLNLIAHAGLQPGDRVLDVGCRAGRAALALARYLAPGNYVGFDVDPVSIRACQRSPELSGFQFFVADVQNQVYRRNGATSGADYTFPLDDGSFDLVFLASVFTHFLEDDCANYAREIMRVLALGGRAVVSIYLRTRFTASQPHRFDHRSGSAHVEYPELPTKLVSYELAEFEQWFSGCTVRPLLGRWRRDGQEQMSEWQDWVVVEMDGSVP
jgi:SAM-dependent methyltransferase